MSFLLIGFIASLIGGFPFCEVGNQGNKENIWLLRWLGYITVGTFLWGFISYLTLPQLIGPFWGSGLTLMVLITLAVNLGHSLVLVDDSSYGNKQAKSVVARASWVAIIALLLPAIRAFTGWSAFNASDYRHFAGKSLTSGDWKEDLSPIDAAHIRMVSRQQAEWSGNKALGQAEGSLGSRYQIGKYTIQKVKNRLVWVAPLEFIGFRSWQRWGSVPGYVMVSAENPSDAPELVINHELKYMHSAFFSSNIERHIYNNGFQTQGHTDYTFEIDDDGKPYWVVTLFDYEISYWGESIAGVLVVDPSTGLIKQYPVEETPKWVDRIIPERFAFERLSWHGRFIHGWWNSWWGEEDVNVPTNPGIALDEMWLVWGTDGKAYWFSGFTSSKSSDSALVGFAMMDSRTGSTRYYRLSGADETAVLQVANSSVSNYEGYRGTQPILYNIYGELTWVVPIISSEHIFQKICLVRASTSEAVLGQTKREALIAYRRLLQSTSNDDSPSSLTGSKTLHGTLSRVAADSNGGNTTYYFVLTEDPTSRIFTGTSSVNYEIVLAKVGDRVAISYFDTKETVVPISGFDLVEFNPRVPLENE